MNSNLRSLSIFVGTSECNAKCKHCAGVIHRKDAEKNDGDINEELIYKTIKECYELGARSISISSSGEPTLSPQSVTKALSLVERARKQGIIYSPINLYSNGIRIGEDKSFSDFYLPLWKEKGLTNLYVTIHDIDEKRNAEVYGVKIYPILKTILSRIHNANLLMRANLVLSNGTINTLEKFVSTINYLENIGVDYIAAWPIRGLDDKIDVNLAPANNELDRIQEWVRSNKKENIRVLSEKNREKYETGQKLTLFPDGNLSGSWCN